MVSEKDASSLNCGYGRGQEEISSSRIIDTPTSQNHSMSALRNFGRDLKPQDSCS